MTGLSGIMGMVSAIIGAPLSVDAVIGHVLSDIRRERMALNLLRRWRGCKPHTSKVGSQIARRQALLRLERRG
jgi:hypothetical protein